MYFIFPAYDTSVVSFPDMGAPSRPREEVVSFHFCLRPWNGTPGLRPDTPFLTLAAYLCLSAPESALWFYLFCCRRWHYLLNDIQSEGRGLQAHHTLQIWHGNKSGGVTIE